MPCKVIPFPAAVSAVRTKEPILARHHVVLEVGTGRYDVDVMGFVTALEPVVAEENGSIRVPPSGPGTERQAATVVRVVKWSSSLRHGWTAELKLEGSKRHWEAYWRRLGIAVPSPASAADKKVKISLALGGRQRDESSCAASAETEGNMTNAQSRDTVANEGTPGGDATNQGRTPRGANRAKGAPKVRKRVRSQAGTSGRTARTKTAAKSATTTATAPSQTPRAQSKGARILELIGRTKGATLAEIVRVTEWQAHSVRGFLSTAGKKYQLGITSVRGENGERVYKAER